MPVNAVHKRSHFHTAHVTDDGWFLAGWLSRKTIRADEKLTQAANGALSISTYSTLPWSSWRRLCLWIIFSYTQHTACKIFYLLTYLVIGGRLDVASRATFVWRGRCASLRGCLCSLARLRLARLHRFPRSSHDPDLLLKASQGQRSSYYSASSRHLEVVTLKWLDYGLILLLRKKPEMENLRWWSLTLKYFYLSLYIR